MGRMKFKFFSWNFTLWCYNARALLPNFLINSTFCRILVRLALAAELTLLRKRAVVLLLFLRSIWPELLPLGFPTFSLLGGHQTYVDLLSFSLGRPLRFGPRIYLLIGRTSKLACSNLLLPVAPIALYFFFCLSCDRSGASVLAFPCPDVSPVFCLDFLGFLEEIEVFGLQPVASFSPCQNFSFVSCLGTCVHPHKKLLVIVDLVITVVPEGA